MTSQIDKARLFKRLHIPSIPLMLVNIRDAGSATAVATSSWSMAASQGYSHGEMLPLDDALATVAGIVKRVEQPVSIDF